VSLAAVAAEDYQVVSDVSPSPLRRDKAQSVRRMEQSRSINTG
jgi:hypothetical protein